MMSNRSFMLLCVLALILLATPAAAFGAGNIASVSKIEGHNWRHGDIEDLLTTVAFIRGHKWSSMQIKRAYFGNWLRDYSQAVDVGTLKGVQAETIRVLIWVLAFMSFGYATEEFEVTADRLGCYRPEEHMDNPKGYPNDAQKYDQRLRGPIRDVELEVDRETAMKNYLANDAGDWATSLGYVKWSFARSIHFGRLYTSGSNKGRSEDLCEALRCLGQGLHCLEDFGAHTNYTELSLRELGFNNVFPHVGTQTMVNVRGKQIYPLVTGTFGGVDFLHSVLGEASDHMTQTEVDQSEVDQVNAALSSAAATTSRGGPDEDPASQISEFTGLLSKIPGTEGFAREALDLQAASNAQARDNDASTAGGYGSYGGQYSSSRAANDSQSFDAPPGSQGGPPGPGISGMDIDPVETVKKIYPILAFRDRVVRTISTVVEKIPGLEKLIDTITEKVTLFVMGLLAPYVKPLIAAATNGLKTGSGGVVAASQKQQYIVWEDPLSSDPTHSMLSKDHFSNVLNEPAGQVAGIILQYAAPRVIYGWDHPEVPEAEILNDVAKIFHHPALRDDRCEIHQKMFQVIEKWSRSNPVGGKDLNNLLSSQSVKAGKNHVVQNLGESLQGLEGQLQNLGPIGGGTSSHSHTAGGPLAMFGMKRDLGGDLGSAAPYSSYTNDGSTYQGSPGHGGASNAYDHTSYSQQSSSGYGQQQSGGYGGGSYEQQGGNQGYSGGYDQQQQGGYNQGGYGRGENQQPGGRYGNEGYGNQRYEGQGGYQGGDGYDRRY